MSILCLKGRIDEGEISIRSSLKIHDDPIMPIINPVLHLCARGVDRPIVDLFRQKSTCSLLTEKGCKYTFGRRPSGGVLLIPDEAGCYSLISDEIVFKLWLEHQAVLQKLVEYYSDNTFAKVIRSHIALLEQDVSEALKLVQDPEQLDESDRNAFKMLFWLKKGCLEIEF